MGKIGIGRAERAMQNGAPAAQCRMQNAECRMNAECAMFAKQTRQVRRSLTLECGMRNESACGAMQNAECRMQNAELLGLCEFRG